MIDDPYQKRLQRLRYLLATANYYTLFRGEGDDTFDAFAQSLRHGESLAYVEDHGDSITYYLSDGVSYSEVAS